MADWTEWWQLEFFRNALAASVLASVLCGVVGTLVVLRRLVALSGSIAHAAFGGLGAAFYGGFDPRLGALGVALGAAAALAGLDARGSERQDAALGVLWAVGMAVGMVFVHLAPGYPPDLLAYLFGNVLLVRSADLAVAAAATGMVLVTFAVAARGLVAVAFDEDQARLDGRPVALLRFVLLALVALSVVVLLQLVGIVLVVALLSIPPLVALRIARGLGAVVATATGVALTTTAGGLALAMVLDWPPGPVMVLLGALLLGLSRLVPPPAARPAARNRAEGKR
jgi:zinc transport system permease protein